MNDFTPLPSLLGGMLIGLAAGALWLASGQIAGIAGIAGGLLRRWNAAGSWRLFFLLGMLAAALALRVGWPGAFTLSGLPRLPLLIAGGLLVGFGTRLGNGCTSGHGVCGVARGSRRSLAATATFVATGMLTVWLFHALAAGAS